MRANPVPARPHTPYLMGPFNTLPHSHKNKEGWLTMSMGVYPSNFNLYYSKETYQTLQKMIFKFFWKEHILYRICSFNE